MNRSTTLAAAALLAACGLASTANAQAILNEIFCNPAAQSAVSPNYSGGDADDQFEYIEIAGRPGMSLEGYAVAVLIGGGSSTTKEVDESYIFPAGATLVDRGSDGLNVGFFTIFHSGATTAFASFVQATNGCTALDVTVPTSDGFAYMETIGTTANVSPYDGPGKLENDGSHTFVLLRKVSAGNYGQWEKDENVEDSTAGLITIDMIDYQIVDEVSFGNDSGEEYDRFDNEISYTPSFIPDAMTRVAYYTSENPERAVVQGLSPWGKTSIADESWVYGDTDDEAINCSGNKYAYDYDTTRYGSPTNYLQANARTSLFFDTKFTVSNAYYLTPGTANTLLDAGQVGPPFSPRLGQVQFLDGDVNFDGVVDCVDRGLIKAAIAASIDLDERLYDFVDLDNEGDYRYQGPALNSLLAIAGLDGDELVEAADLTAFDADHCGICDDAPACVSPAQSADVNGDGVVDIHDVYEVLNNAN